MVKKPRIFIIDDEEILTQSLSQYLRAENYQVEAAHDGESALQMLPVVKPDLILLDILLPKISGIEFLKKIREPESEFKDTPVIIVSALSGDKATIEKMGLKVTDYFVKTSGSVSELTDKIKSTLKNAGKIQN